MSKEKKVWISILDYAHVKVHSIGMNIPETYDYQALQANNLKYLKDPKNEELINTNKEIASCGAKMAENIQQFNKLPATPDSLWLENDSAPLPTQSDYLFQVRWGGIVLNEACANILKQFNLGESTLTPLKIHKLFTDELWLDDTFYFFNFFERREYIIVPQPHHDDFEFSPKARTPYYSRKALVLDDNMLVINKSATECDLDLWHDPRFMSSYFMSDNLYQALVEANMHEKWNAHFCKLI